MLRRALSAGGERESPRFRKAVIISLRWFGIFSVCVITYNIIV